MLANRDKLRRDEVRKKLGTVDIYTDGGCVGNPGPGGWAAVVYDGPNPIEFSGFEDDTTNQRMELKAAIEGLRFVEHADKIKLYSDSAYLIEGMNQGWHLKWEKNGWKTSSKKPVQNQDLWRELLSLTEHHDVEWIKVKAHSGIAANERCDSLVQQAIQNKRGISANEESTSKVTDDINTLGRRYYRIEDELEQLNPYFLSAISAVPILGGSIAQLLSGMGQNIVQERNKKLFEQLSGLIEVFGEQTIKKDYFQTPEGFDLLIKALETSGKTRSEEKRTLVARILAGAASADAERGDYSPEEYLYLISDLTVQELLVARSIYEDHPETYEAWTEWEKRACDIIGIEKADLHLAVRRLASTGLLETITSGFTEHGLAAYTPEYGEGSYHMITESFDRLMKFLQLKT